MFSLAVITTVFAVIRGTAVSTFTNWAELAGPASVVWPKVNV